MSISTKTMEAAGNYQYVLDGKTVLLSQMTHEQALRALMQTMDMLERFEDKLADLSEMYENWCCEGE